METIFWNNLVPNMKCTRRIYFILLLICNKIPDRITKVWKTAQQNYSETVTNENYKEMPKERYIPPEERQNVIHDLKLI